MLKKIKYNKRKYCKLENQQETLLISVVNNINKGSSETTRETILNKDFLYWFIGFFEGNGSFIQLKDKRIFIVIVQNELVVLYKIKSFFNKGRVQKHGKYFRYIITLQKDIDFFFDNVFFCFYTTRYLNKLNMFLNIKLKNKKVLLSNDYLLNAWLSGFIDAEGCFYIRLVKRDSYKFGYQIRLVFILDQLFEDLNYNIFFDLKNIFNNGFIEQRKNSNNFRFKLENNKDLDILIKYLSRYPLKSQKKLIQYKKWLKALNIKKKEVKTEKDLLRLKVLKNWRYSPPLYENIKN